MKSYYNDSQAQKDIKRLYQSKLDELPIHYEFITIETSFGDTNLILTGSENKPPLVLIHGSNSCAPIALEALIGLARDFRIYAIDVIGQPNLSKETRPSMQDNSYGQWMHEILSRLKIYDVYIVGISIGGFIGWKTLVFEEKRISKAFLITPAGLVNGNPLRIFWKVVLPLKQYKWSEKMKHIHRFIKALFTERDEFAIAFSSRVFLHFDIDFSPIPLIGEREASIIQTPLYLIATEKDLLFPGKKMLKRARRLFPSLRETLLLKNNRHIPGRAEYKEIEKMIRDSM